MAVRFRDILSRVLRNVGEPEIASAATEVTGDYNKLIANFVNTVKEEIEDATQWRVLRQTLTFTVTAGQTTAVNTNADERARLVRLQNPDGGEYVPLVFDVTDPANPILLTEASLDIVVYNNMSMPAGYQGTSIAMFAMDSYTDGTTAPQARVTIHPAQTTERTLSVVMTVPQARMADADVNVWIKIPAGPLELGATWYAILERGEELGPNSMFTEERYKAALNSAISRDDTEQGGTVLVPT